MAAASTVGEDLGRIDAALRVEERFDRVRRAVGLVAGPVVLALLLWVPMPTLSTEAHRLAAVSAFTVVWWVTEAVPLAVTALLSVALAVLLGVAPAQEAFAQFGSPTIFVFLGAFIIGRAVSEHALDLRIARSVLAIPAVGVSVFRTQAAIGALTTGISGFMNNTAVAAMMTPIAVGVLRERGVSTTVPSGFATGLLLTVGYAATIGGMLTPIGAAPNLVTIGLLETMTGTRVSFFAWMALCVPIALTMTVALVVGVKWLFADQVHMTGGVASERERTASWTRGQLNCAFVFAVAVLLWVSPALLGLWWPDAAVSRFADERLDEGVVAVGAASLLFMLPLDWRQRRFTMTWQQAAGIDWGTLMMFGGGLALGRLMFTTGLAAALGQAIVNISGADTLWTITMIAAVVSILLTEIVSNTATTSMLVPVVIGICQASGVSAVPPAVAVCLGASLSFMLPVSTPPNAIVYATGLVPMGAMIRAGVLLDVVGFFVIVGGLRVLCPLLGVA